MAKSTGRKVPNPSAANESQQATHCTQTTAATWKQATWISEDSENGIPMGHVHQVTVHTSYMTHSANAVLVDNMLNEPSEPAAMTIAQKSKASHRASTGVSMTNGKSKW